MSSISIPTTQYAYSISEHGDRDLLVPKSIPVPDVGPDDVLIKAEYAGLNFIDSYIRSGLYKWKLPLVLGREGAGTVVKVGKNVSKYKVGDKVGYSGSASNGTFTHYIAVKENEFLTHVPEKLDTKTVAASLVSGLTALTFINEAYKVKKGDYVLIQAVAGGLGLVLTQLIKSIGGIVIGTTSSEYKAKIAKEAGADHIIYYRKESVPDAVNKITNGKGVQVVYDGVGYDTYLDSLASLAVKGSLVFVGNASGKVPLFDIYSLTAKNNKLVRPTLYNYISQPEEWSYYTNLLFEKLASKELKIHIFKEYDFDNYKQGAEDLETGKTVGKLVLKIN